MMIRDTIVVVLFVVQIYFMVTPRVRVKFTALFVALLQFSPRVFIWKDSSDQFSSYGMFYAAPLKTSFSSVWGTKGWSRLSSLLL